MVNVTPPLHPVHKQGLWPPKTGREYTVLDTDDWWKIAAREHIDPWDLIKFNFATHVPEEVNYYLHELVGCRHTKDGRNYTFAGADPSKRKIYLPPAPVVPPKPVPVTWYEKLKKLKFEVEHSNDPLKARFLCMLNAMENRRDDRVIFWGDIAPGNATPVPLTVTKNSSRSLAETKWLSDTFKTWEDVAALPLGDGTSARRFVLSLHKFLFETADGSLFALRGAHASILETRVMLERWATFDMGGGGSMPAEYRAIKRFIRLGEGSDAGTVVSCITTTGNEP
jgi:hypothetical protein